MLVGLDFDGTIVKNKYPSMGDDLGAMPWLKKAQKMGAQFILITMRDGKELEDAVKHLTTGGIKLHGTNCNPTQWQWTMSPKIYCQLYVDDNALGIPLDVNHDVDWSQAGPALLRAVEKWQDRHPGGKKITRGGRYTGSSHG
jgi:hypothetical protein